MIFLLIYSMSSLYDHYNFSLLLLYPSHSISHSTLHFLSASCPNFLDFGQWIKLTNCKSTPRIRPASLAYWDEACLSYTLIIEFDIHYVSCAKYSEWYEEPEEDILPTKKHPWLGGFHVPKWVFWSWIIYGKPNWPKWWAFVLRTGSCEIGSNLVVEAKSCASAWGQKGQKYRFGWHRWPF